MAVTEADIGRLACDILTEGTFTALSDDVAAARLITRNFATTRQAEIRKHAWNFALSSSSITSTDLGALGTGSMRYRYAMPATALKIIPLTSDGEPQGTPIMWRVEGRFIFSDQVGPRIIRYVIDKTDPTDWDPLFVDVMAAALAIKIAHPVTGKAEMVKVAQTAYDRALQAAVAANAIEYGFGAEDDTTNVIARLVADILIAGGEFAGIVDTDKAHRLVLRNFADTRKAELRKHPWNFALSSSSVTGTDLGLAAGALTWKYAWPATALKILPLTYDGEPQGLPLTWRSEGRFVYTDQATPRVLRYVIDVTDPANWDSLFVDVMAGALAVKVAFAVTGKPEVVKIAQAAYDRAVAAALASNAIEFGFGVSRLRGYSAGQQESINVLARLVADLLTGTEATAIIDNDKAVRLVARHFINTRRAELRKHTWNFALGSGEVEGTDLATDSGTLNWKYPTPAAFPGSTNIVLNAGFTTDTIWTKGAGWTIAAGVATKAAGVQSDLSQAIIGEEKRVYRVTFTISGYVAGQITPSFQTSGQNTLVVGTARTADGTYTEDMLFTNDAALFAFRASSTFVGSIDAVTIYPLAKTLRVLPLTYDGQPQGVGISYRVEGDWIYSDQISPRIVRFISDIEDVDDWDPLFLDVMTAALAVHVALPLTQNLGVVQLAKQAYKDAVSAALMANALERQGRLNTNSWATARGDTRGWWRA